MTWQFAFQLKEEKQGECKRQRSEEKEGEVWDVARVMSVLKKIHKNWFKRLKYAICQCPLEYCICLHESKISKQ